MPPLPERAAALCEDRFEIGIRGGWPGALAERMTVPATALHALPDTVDATAGALVEPGGNALRAVQGADLESGARVLVLGPGTIGLLAARFALAHGAEVHVMGLSQRSLDFARTLGVHGAWTADRLPALPFDAVIDASNASGLPPGPLTWWSRENEWSTSASRAAPAPSTPARWCSRTSRPSGS
ncbi:hypothetical protein ACFQX6_16780 [Streptosporangium lutulentum]